MKVRICVDNRRVNQAILRDRHSTPTVEQLIHDLNGSVIFSKPDLHHAFWQIVISSESRYITTFSTPIGNFRFKRLNFVLNFSSEICYQQCNKYSVNVINICDDILIHGQSQEGHDIALNAVIERLVRKGLTLNKSKCKLNQTEVEFCGFVFDKSGVYCHANEFSLFIYLFICFNNPCSELKVFKKLQPLHNAADTFLSMMQYSSRFIRDFSSISEPLREVLSRGSGMLNNNVYLIC